MTHRNPILASFGAPCADQITLQLKSLVFYTSPTTLLQLDLHVVSRVAAWMQLPSAPSKHASTHGQTVQADLAMWPEAPRGSCKRPLRKGANTLTLVLVHTPIFHLVAPRRLLARNAADAMADTANAPPGQPVPAPASSAAPRMCTLHTGHDPSHPGQRRKRSLGTTSCRARTDY